MVDIAVGTSRDKGTSRRARGNTGAVEREMMSSERTAELEA